MHASSKFQRNNMITSGIIAVLPCLIETFLKAKRLVVAILLKTKAHGTCKTKSIPKRLKHPNRTVKPQAFG